MMYIVAIRTSINDQITLYSDYWYNLKYEKMIRNKKLYNTINTINENMGNSDRVAAGYMIMTHKQYSYHSHQSSSWSKIISVKNK